METFTSVKPMVANPDFADQRRRALSQLDLQQIDTPIVDIVSRFNKLTHCFTQQCCYGHFLYGNQMDKTNLVPLPLSTETTQVEYRIAYLALCINNGVAGASLLQDLAAMVTVDAERIQFGCAEWFWQRQVNSYALQVEPVRHQCEDSVVIDYQEALQVQSTRDLVFAKLRQLLNR